MNISNVSNEIVNIGDVFYSSWGYEQTNVDFYQVVGKRGTKTVLLRKIKDERNYRNSMSGVCFPKIDDFEDDEVLSRRLGKDGFVKINGYQHAQLLPFKEVHGQRLFNKCNFSSYA